LHYDGAHLESGEMYERLDALEILRTAERLGQRISERFPGASLSKLAARLVEITRDSITEVARLRRPNVLLRIGVGMLLLVGFAVLVLALPQLHVNYQVNAISELMQTIEATLGILFFLGTGVFFFVKLEDRLKRGRTLRVVHNLRTVAHIVDMHQLTKDPEAILMGLPPTASSPERTLSEFELRRYRLLNLISTRLTDCRRCPLLPAEPPGSGRTWRVSSVPSPMPDPRAERDLSRQAASKSRWFPRPPIGRSQGRRDPASRLPKRQELPMGLRVWGERLLLRVFEWEDLRCRRPAWWA
jgi:hypothetical protein